MIDLDRLQTFIYAAESLSFSEAAKLSHISQPTVSYHVKTLEQDLETELFIRAGHTLQLTEAGHFLLPYARKLIRQSNEIQEMVSSFQQKIIGQLRIACSTAAGKYILPKLAGRFRQKYPGIQVSILACTSEHIAPRLLEGEANLGVVSHEIEHSGLEYQEFFDDYVTLIAATEHPWAQQQSLDPSDLVKEPMLIREPTSGTRRMLLAELAQHDITLDDLNIFLELGNAEAITETVASGFGVAFVSRLASANALEQRRVVEIPVLGFELRRKVYMVRKTIEAPNRSQEAFWTYVHHPENIDLLRLAESP